MSKLNVVKNLWKYGKQMSQAADKAKADDIAAAAKKAKEIADKKAAAEKAKKIYAEGVKAGKKKGAASTKRKMVAGAAAAGTIYYEGKTGGVSKGIKKAIDYTKTKKPTSAAQKQVEKKAAEIAKKTRAAVSKAPVKKNTKTTKK
jgi:hypothetical protein